MPIAGIHVNTAGAGVVASFAPIPKGKYEALIQGHEIKIDNGNAAINFTFLVVAGEFKDRKLFERITLQGSPKAVAYGMRILNSIGRVFGYPEGDWNDAMLANLRGKRVILDVDVENERFDAQSGKTFKARNTIDGYESPTSGSQAPMPMQQAPAYAPAPAAVGQTGYAPPQQQYAQPPQQPAYAPPPQQQPMLPPQSGYAQQAPAPATPPPAAPQQPSWMAGAQQ